jgi:FdhE protein
VPTILEALTEAAQRDPDLASYYELHIALIELQEEAKRSIGATLEMADAGALEARLREGLPLIAFEQLPIQPAQFAELSLEIAQVLLDHEVEMVDRMLPDEVDWLSLARQQFEGEPSGEGADQALEGTTLARMAASLALKPYLMWAAEQVMPHVDEALWRRGYCPVCGGAPDFAALDEETGARHLLCSRCNSEWLYHRLGCPFCETTDHTQISYYVSDDGVYRLYVCDACQRYLKTIDLREVNREVLLPVERLTTLAMDAAARQEGYV